MNKFHRTNIYKTISSHHGSIQSRIKKKKNHFATQLQMIKSGIQKLKVFKRRKKSKKKKERKETVSKRQKKKKQETCGEPVRDTVRPSGTSKNTFK